MSENASTATATPSAEASAPAATASTEPQAAPVSDAATAAEIVDAVAKEGEVKAEEAKPEPAPKKTKKAPEIAKVKAREVAISTKEKELAEKESRIQKFEQEVNKETFLKNPTKILAKYGITFQDLAEALVNEGEPEAPKSDSQLALEKIAALEKKEQEKEEARQAELEKNKQAYIDRVFADYKGKIVEHVNANEEKYELVKLQQKHDLVFEIQEQYHLKHGKILELDQACEIAETYLEKSVQPLLKAKKFQKVEAPPKVESSAKTLSSTLAAASSGSSSATGRILSREERIKLAAEKLQFN
jgi:hypothetical protein